MARIGLAGNPLPIAIRVGHKEVSHGGVSRQGCEEFVCDALTRYSTGIPASLFCTLLVGLDGDGVDKLIRHNGEVLNHYGDMPA